MPDWAASLVTYGPLGIFALFVFVVAIPAVWKQLFSRDEKSLGLVVMKVRSSVAKDEKMSEFVDALAKRDDRQEQLCQLHARSLETLVGGLDTHHAMSQTTNHDVAGLKAAALEACNLARELAVNEWPKSVELVQRRCDEIERRIGEA